MYRLPLYGTEHLSKEPALYCVVVCAIMEQGIAVVAETRWEVGPEELKNKYMLQPAGVDIPLAPADDFAVIRPRMSSNVWPSQAEEHQIVQSFQSYWYGRAQTILHELHRGVVTH